MSAKNNTILLMNSISFPHKILDSVIGKILLATLQTIIGSVILLLTFLVRQTVDIIVLKYAIVMAVGLLAGFSARRLLTENTQLLKLLVAWIAASLSLAGLYIISSGFIGINLFSPLQNSPDWRSLSELTLSALTAWMTLAAYRNNIHLIETPDDEPTMHAAPSRLNLFFESSKSKVNSWKANINQRLIQLKGSLRAITAQPLKLSSRQAQRQEPKKIVVSRQQSAKNKPAQKIKTPGRIKKNAPRKKKPIASAKFIGKQEHSCPYCLEVVESNDPRGVKVCSICQTHHHADCWGITGTCQIPHALD